MSAKNSNITTIATALVLCLVCSVMVSVAAISMKPKQDKNITLDRNKNILMAANLFDPAKDTAADAEARFANVEMKLVDLSKGVYASEEELKAAGITNVDSYDANKAAKDPKLNIDLGNDDPARIGAIPKFATVYLIKDDKGALSSIVLPINGSGLWGQIYGFITLKNDINTIEGLSFYQHKETPGLGALIEESKWRSQWADKKAYDDNGTVSAGVVKSGTPKPTPNYVDGVTGATITSLGVNKMVQFWLGERGYKPFLDNLKAGKEG
ncbi:MAG: Na(+)-translocating NADH-quinone reductase subunit C [Moraxella sp.]|nr:Na(+)-translocating NADH-quinone reductase subunit C [Moraxella sp.]